MNAETTFSEADAEVPFPPVYYRAGSVLNFLTIVLALAALFIIAPVLAGFIGGFLGYESDYGFTIGDVTVLVLLALPIFGLFSYRHHMDSTVGQWQPLYLENRVKIMTKAATFRGEFQNMAFSAKIVLWLDSPEMHDKLTERMEDLEALVHKSIVRGLNDSKNRLAKAELEEFVLTYMRVPHVKKVNISDMSFRPS